MSNDKKQKEKYDIGFGKPPKHAQFKPGQSGNPAGRPKGSKNLKTLLQEELGELIFIMENGKRKKVAKGKGLIKTLVNQALTGNLRAMTIVLEEERSSPLNMPEACIDEAENEPLTEEEAARMYAEALKKAESDE